MGLADLGAGLGNLLATPLALLTDPDNGNEQRRQAIAEWQALQGYLPRYDTADIPAPFYSPGASYVAEQYQPVQLGPVALPEEGPEGRSSQVGALQQLQQIGREGLPLSERIAAEQQMDRLRAAYGGAMRGGLESLQRRGRSGGGLEAAMRADANSNLRQLASDQGDMLAAQSGYNRLAGSQAAGALGGQLRLSDLAYSQARSNPLNQHNQFFSQMMTQAAMQNAANRQGASNANVGRQQQTGDASVAATYGASRENQANRNALMQQGFQNRYNITAGQTGALQNLARGQDVAQQAYQENVLNAGRGLGQAVGGIADYSGASSQPTGGGGGPDWLTINRNPDLFNDMLR